MFNFFKKKTQIQGLIDQDGIEHVTDRFAEIVSRKLPTKEFAYQFILQELDGASKGNSKSKQFADSSGIPAAEYIGALLNSDLEIDGPNGPQQLLLGLSLQLSSNQDLMADFRCKVDEKIMKRFSLGKYATPVSSFENVSVNTQTTSPSYPIKLIDIVPKVTNTAYIFDAIMADLGSAADEIMDGTKQVQMAYGYARRLSAAALHIQGHFDKDSFDYVKSIFKSLQIHTDGSVEFQEKAFVDAIEFMQTYHHIITSLFAKQMYAIALHSELPGTHINDEELIRIVLHALHQGEKNKM